MKDNEGSKYFSGEEKCTLMQQTWKYVFKITVEDENNFDTDHSEHIDQHINVNNNRIKYFPTASLNKINTKSIHAQWRSSGGGREGAV